MDKITLVAIAAPVVVVLFGLFVTATQEESPLTVKPVKEKITINVLCIEGYEYIQNTTYGTGSTIYTQRFINTDDGLRAKICRDVEEGIDAD